MTEEKYQADEEAAKEPFLEHSPQLSVDSGSLEVLLLDLENDNDAQISRRDLQNFLVLFILYFIIGIPPSLIGGTLPVFLKDLLSYRQIGQISIVLYVYSLKVLWGPAIDAFWISSIGWRKTWLVPCLLFSGAILIGLGSGMDRILHSISRSGFTLAMFIIALTLFALLVSTLAMATNGWAVVLFSTVKLPYASMAHSLGETSGSFTGYSLFLGLNSHLWSRFLFNESENPGILSLGTFLIFVGLFCLALGILIILFVSEPNRPQPPKGTMRKAYKSMYRMLCLRPVQLLIAVHLTARLAFAAHDGATTLKLMEKGLGQGNLALMASVTVPFELGLGYLGGRWCAKYHSLDVWCWAFVARTATAAIAQMLVWFFPTNETSFSCLIGVQVLYILNNSAMTVSFVSIMAWHYHIAQKDIGGSYIALLST